MSDAGHANDTSIDPRTLLLEAPMSRFQWLSIFVIGGLYMLDGFDVLAMSFAAPALIAHEGFTKVQVGSALSAGLLGMAFGSIALSPIADVIGRRRVLFGALGLMIAGCFWTASSAGLLILVASRVVTGLGIGAMIGILSPLSAEYANSKRRDFAISIATLGFGFGATLGGLVSAGLLGSFGWRAVFVFGGCLGVLLGVFAWFFILDSVAFSVTRPGRDGLARVNAYLRRCGHSPVASLPAPPERHSVPLQALFASGVRRDTITLILIYFCYQIPQYFLQTWLPTLVADLGFAPARAAFVSSFMSAGTIIGGTTVAFTTLMFDLRRLGLCFVAGTAVIAFVFALLPADFVLLIIGGTTAGIFTGGATVALYTLIARSFPTHLRASGTGVTIGIGRLGSILPPAIAGLLFTAGWGRIPISALLAAPGLISVALLFTFRLRPATVA